MSASVEKGALFLQEHALGMHDSALRGGRDTGLSMGLPTCYNPKTKVCLPIKKSDTFSVVVIVFWIQEEKGFS